MQREQPPIPPGLAPAKRLLSRLAEPYSLFPLIALVLLVVVWGSTINLIQVERGIATKAAAASTVELADTYEAQVVRSLREIDQSLKVLRFAHERSAGRVEMGELKAKGLLPPELLFTVSLADSSGRIVASSPPFGKASVADEEYFASVRASDVPAVSRPVTGPGDQEAKLHFVRRLESAQGSFEGAAIISVPAAHFVSGYEVAKLGNEGLLGSDGVFRARRSGDTVVAGESWPRLIGQILRFDK